MVLECSPAEKALDSVKAELSSPSVLALYNHNHRSYVSADALSYALDAVISQKKPTGEWCPIAYQSRSMTSAKQHYCQIEKEALAIAWACNRFSQYLFGSTFQIEQTTNHSSHFLALKLLISYLPESFASDFIL